METIAQIFALVTVRWFGLLFTKKQQLDGIIMYLAVQFKSEEAVVAGEKLLGIYAHISINWSA